jgi:hypothetical protein
MGQRKGAWKSATGIRVVARRVSTGDRLVDLREWTARDRRRRGASAGERESGDKIADAAGLPQTSRTATAAEADDADTPRIIRQLGHSKVKTTDIYRREDLEVDRELARARVEKRKWRPHKMSGPGMSAEIEVSRLAWGNV